MVGFTKIKLRFFNLTKHQYLWYIINFTRSYTAKRALNIIEGFSRLL
jgi:hypothetical protein